MTEISLESLNLLVERARELQKLLTESPEILEYLRLIRQGENNILPIKSDVLIRVGEAAKILCVSKATIYKYAVDRKLTPYYTANSEQMKFWYSDVKALAKKGK